MKLDFYFSTVILLGSVVCYEYNPYEPSFEEVPEDSNTTMNPMFSTALQIAQVTHGTLPVNFETTGKTENPGIYKRGKTIGPLEYSMKPKNNVFQCTRGQICIIPISSIKKLHSHFIVSPIRISALSGNLSFSISPDQTNLIALPLEPGLSTQKIIHYTMKRELVEIMFNVSIIENPWHNHQFKIVLKGPSLIYFDKYPENFKDFVISLAKALEGPSTSLSVDSIHYEGTTVVFNIHNNSLSSTECKMNEILAMQRKMFSIPGELNKDFVHRMGKYFEIGTVRLETFGTCNNQRIFGLFSAVDFTLIVVYMIFGVFVTGVLIFLVFDNVNLHNNRPMPVNEFELV
uniref:Peptidase S72 domain-containing protein n=1 Tax=Caenorhabditis tropicalis TaxID=1561998 RepID=A0A1I7TLP9_9PELO